ncbi:MAG: aminoglycoside phosphotransferase family protein [Oscillospiraceae bacterium]|jgi:hygromycin-B 4-O-kinase|nr:aminoglycoside phosphotransferase family protein [Oscillospiraceae bacterium]
MIKPELTTVAEKILKLNYPSDELVKTLTPLKGGEWSAAYKYHIAGQDFVIRLSHIPDNFYRDKTAARWSSPGLPIPTIIKIDRYQDQHYAISPFFQGEPFEMLSADDLEQTIPDFLTMMTALQSISLEAAEGFGTLTPDGQGTFHSWSEALLDVINDRPDNLVHGWKKILAENPAAQRKVNLFYRCLTDLVQYCPEMKRPIHSDLLYQNLLVNDRRISAVLDWGCAMIGDPVYDIGIFAFFEPWYPAFTQTNLVHKMRQSYLTQSPGNALHFGQRMAACQIHLTLGNIAYCIYSDGKHDYNEHIDRLEEVLEGAGLRGDV